MKITVGNVYSKVIQCSIEEDDLLAKILCVAQPGHEFMPRFRSHLWDGMKSFYTPVAKTFPTGFLPFIIEQAHSEKYKVETFDERNVPSLQDPTRISQLYPQLYKYQRAAVMQLLTSTLRTDTETLPWLRGILKFPPNTGKTFMAGCLIDFIHKRTLYLVQSQELFYQTQKAFRTYTTMTLGLLGDGEEELTADITFAMVQTIQARLDGEKRYIDSLKKLESEEKSLPTDVEIATTLAKLRVRKRKIEIFLKGIECLVIDEAHHLDKGVYHQIATRCPAPFRYALSATPLKRGDLGDVYLIGDVGEILAEGDRDALEHQGYIGKPHVAIFTITEPRVYRMPYKQAYRACIVENDYRNECIVEATRVLRSINCTILILVKYYSHGQILQSMLAQADLPSQFLSRKDRHKTRRAGLDALGDTNHILIATKILNEGIDLPRLNGVIRAGGGASDIASIQEVGRGRAKDIVYIVDFKDCTHKDLLKNFAERLATYEQERFRIAFPKTPLIPDHINT